MSNSLLLIRTRFNQIYQHEEEEITRTAN